MSGETLTRCSEVEMSTTGRQKNRWLTPACNNDRWWMHLIVGYTLPFAETWGSEWERTHWVSCVNVLESILPHPLTRMIPGSTAAGVSPSEFWEDADKTRIVGLLYGEKNDGSTLSRFHLIPERTGRRKDGRTDRQTEDIITISISRVIVQTRDKNRLDSNMY